MSQNIEENFRVFIYKSKGEDREVVNGKTDVKYLAGKEGNFSLNQEGDVGGRVRFYRVSIWLR